ncbi:uncharacterized protein LOC124297783 [Neodiprion virginianus]|uniref:uncharacterized protein LOC124297783 n=1 Tax=Neodiprion virginianus TaxID=2961670 RepID=UPI001EE6F650|nr:uncharacterized protein LOC124297783 [Neodiprion virginianus]
MSFAGQNKGYKYMLTVIDIFSKYVWAITIKSKCGDDVKQAMESVLVQGQVPKNSHVDRGPEFYNSKSESLMSRYGIELYSTYSNLKASICKRFNRTLEGEMWTPFSMQGSYEWLDILPDLISTYNITKHPSIRMKPSDVTVANERRIFQIYLQYLTELRIVRDGKIVALSET